MRTWTAVLAVTVLLSFAVAGFGVEYSGQIYTQNFTGADGTLPAGWAAGVWGTNGSSAKVEIRGNALYVDENGATQNLIGISKTVFSSIPANGAFLKADYLQSTNLSGSWIQFAGPYAVKYICNPPGTHYQQVYWNGAAQPSGGATNVPCASWGALTKLHVGRGPDGVGVQGVLSFINKKFNVGFWDNNVETLASSLTFVAQKDTPPRTTNDNVRFDNVVAYAPAIIDFTNTVLWAPLYSEEFDSPSLGPEWTLQSSATLDKFRCVVSQDLSRLEFTVNTNAPANWSWVTAWVAFTNATALGRPLRVGEYVEAGVTRANGARIGLDVFGRKFRPSNVTYGGNDYICSYLGGSDKFGSPQVDSEERLSADTYDWDKPDGEWNRIGLRVDYADGDFMVISLYMDRQYATSWLFSTTETNLIRVGVHAQGDGSVINGMAWCGYLKVYAPATQSMAPLAGYQSDFRSPNFPPRWQYLWNANGPIGASTNYAPLLWNTNQSRYTYDGKPLSSTNYVSLSSIGGHPGMGFSQTNFERYAIAAYTVPYAGEYALTDSYIRRSTTSASDGVRVRVYVDNTLKQSSVVTVSGTNSFDVALGHLRGGQTIYAAVGSYSAWNSDSFLWDFSVTATPARGSAFSFR